MKKTLFITTLLLALGSYGIGHASASTYIVNASGDAASCGAYCAELNTYLTSQGEQPVALTSTVNDLSRYGITSGNGSANGSSNLSTSGSNNGANYAVNGSGGPNNGTYGSNAYGSSTLQNYIQYPYLKYTYFQNPNPYPNSGADAYANGSPYPTPIYTYYGKNTTASKTYPKYKTTDYSSYSTSQSTGFTLTSGK